MRGAWNGLMLDEIWSLNLVSAISSPLEIFTKLHNSNNHYLNSLWLYVMGVRGNWPGYRILSILAGIGAVLVAGLIGRRRNQINAYFAMLLIGFSYVNILYSCEARGYSTLIFFSLLFYYWLEVFLERNDWRIAILISCSSILAFCSQLIFINAFVAAILWSGWRLVKSKRPIRKVVTSMVLCHGPPILFLWILYVVDLRHMDAIEATETTLWRCYTTAIAWILPPLSPGWWTYFMCLLATAGILAGISVLWRRNRDALLFFVTVILVAPVLLVILSHSTFLYVRHFLLSITFALMLISFALTSLYFCGWKGRIASACLLGVYLAVNAWPVANLFSNGQGNYGDAIRFLKEHSRAEVITIGGDQDFRVGTVLDFYGRELFKDRPAAYYLQGNWPPGGPEWVIIQKEAYEEPSSPTKELGLREGHRWEFVKTVQAAPLSSQHWFIYHNVEK